jgi:hypothetical protein
LCGGTQEKLGVDLVADTWRGIFFSMMASMVSDVFQTTLKNKRAALEHLKVEPEVNHLYL